MDAKLLKVALAAQRVEMTEYHVYHRLADRTKDPKNAAILRKIGDQEKGHAAYWQSKTGVTVKPNTWNIFRYVMLATLLGPTFVLKQMEKNEGTGSKLYKGLSDEFPEVAQFSLDESAHEKKILNMIEEERLQYVGSIVLGLNDALVELTGALAGFTLALGDTRFISLAGLVTGIAAAMSMTASAYLSSKADGDVTAKRSAIYTGVAYLITVVLLILPFLLISSKFLALGITLCIGVLIIFCFNYYISVAKDLNFKARFTEMTVISLSVALISFLIGYGLKFLLGVDA
ncbi:MAG TPA: VIT1/CCC1 transporter family protein [Bacteroidales bacterium]|nr:VIT1/CCC1 transporter family protein [Bacteroidales bacterium]